MSIESELHQKLYTQTARIPGEQLQRFFAKGVVLEVKQKVNLLDMGVILGADNAASLSSHIDNEDIRYLQNDVAKKWFKNKAIVWSLVVAPYVLVQFSHYDGEINVK